MRLKAWEGLPRPSDSHHEPPDEVKNILSPVLLQGDGSIKAWICYPSTSVVKDEILTPDSKYDCRMKLRVGMFTGPVCSYSALSLQFASLKYPLKWGRTELIAVFILETNNAFEQELDRKSKCKDY